MLELSVQMGAYDRDTYLGFSLEFTLMLNRYGLCL